MNVEALAIAAHGGGAVLAFLGIVFHILKEGTVRDRDVAIHSAALVYHLRAIWKHARRL